MILNQPHAQWFDALGTCRGCGKAATGVIRGTQNQSFGPACRRCAESAIKAAHRKKQFLPDIELGERG
jgi:hypothetical protein